MRTRDRSTSLAALMLSLALVTGASSRAAADAWRPWLGQPDDSHAIADGNVVDVQIQVNGRTAPLYFRPGQSDRHYFQAFKGRNYALVLRNTTDRRIGVLIAVDGLNVVSGERSSLARNEAMYVLDPYERAVIQGWRTSLDDVRKFVFVDEQRSYAQRTGQANGDMGWIRVVAYREVEPVSRWIRPQPRGWMEDGRESDSRTNDRENAAAPPAAPAPREQGGRARDEASNEGLQKSAPMAESFRGDAPQSNPGTGWGAHQHDPVQQTWFQAQAWAADQIVLRYEYQDGLRALGITPRGMRLWEREEGQLGFAQPPRR